MQLLIMAAGIGSRYGGLKQMDGFGPSGETLMEFAIYDAARSGFDEVVFILREDMVDDLYEKFDHQFGGKIKMNHAVQHLTVDYEGQTIERAKPWGTAHAILSARDVIHSPFAVINADDYYGITAFQQLAHFFNTSEDENQYALVGYMLENTLSESGYVARGVCQSDDHGLLTDIEEKTRIEKEGDLILNTADGAREELAPETLVSMNCWAFKPQIFPYIATGFDQFLAENHQSEKAEYYIPSLLSDLMHRDIIEIKVMESAERWFGVTYKEDREVVKRNIAELIEKGDYPSSLWAS